MRRVAITGMGLVSPLGNTVSQFFDNLVSGVSAIRRLQDTFAERLLSPIAATAEFDAAAYFPAAKYRMLDRVSQFALKAADD
ncbi:MAG TPA: beta-ketoacyl synthase N-terminal-like domain-containing protein, partial [Methylophilaceae bacterium]|nr:beta-ketoacyl synthase N-terminal-like domain-containing protein [Methylophilaceae bacterium]